MINIFLSEFGLDVWHKFNIFLTFIMLFISILYKRCVLRKAAKNKEKNLLEAYKANILFDFQFKNIRQTSVWWWHPS